MSDFLSRLKTEKEELSQKINKLGDFLSTESFLKLSEANRILLQEQLSVMIRYQSILVIRIELIEK